MELRITAWAPAGYAPQRDAIALWGSSLAVASRGAGNGFRSQANFDGRFGPWFPSNSSGPSGWQPLSLGLPHAEDRSVRSSPSTITPQRY